MERSIIRILLVDDFKPYRHFITSLLSKNADLRIIGGLPKLNGLEAARQICQLVPSSKVIFLTQETSSEVVKEAISLGTSGYIVKQDAGTQLLAGLEAIFQGKQFVSSSVTDDRFPSPPQAPPTKE